MQMQTTRGATTHSEHSHRTSQLVGGWWIEWLEVFQALALRRSDEADEAPELVQAMPGLVEELLATR